MISYEEYSPYGSTSYRASPSGTEVSARRYRYTGKERDEETGLYYYGARYYAAWLGRWTSADPLGLQAGVNLYLYCRAGPVTYVDPDGMQEVNQTLKEEFLAGAQSTDPGAQQTESIPPGLDTSLPPDVMTGQSVDPSAPAAKSRPVSKPAGLQGDAEVEQLHVKVNLFADDQVAWAAQEAADPTNPWYVQGLAHLAAIAAVPAALGENAALGVLNIPYDLAKAGQLYGIAAQTQNPDEALDIALQGAFHATKAAGSVAAAESTISGLGEGVAGPTLAEQRAAQFANGGDGVASNEAHSQLLETLRLRGRSLELGTGDAAHGPTAINALEGQGAVRIEQALGRTVTRGEHPGVDYVDIRLGPLSLKGPIPANGDPQGLSRSALKDLQSNSATKTLFVDLTGLSRDQAAVARELIEAGSVGSPKRLFFLGGK